MLLEETKETEKEGKILKNKTAIIIVEGEKAIVYLKVV